MNTSRPSPIIFITPYYLRLYRLSLPQPLYTSYTDMYYRDEYRVYNYNSIKKWRANNYDKWRTYERDRKRKMQKALIELLGGKCILCNRTQEKTPLIVHEIHGRPHTENINEIMRHKEDYVILCRPHHAMIHRMKNEQKLEIMIHLLEKLQER